MSFKEECDDRGQLPLSFLMLSWPELLAASLGFAH